MRKFTSAIQDIASDMVGKPLGGERGGTNGHCISSTKFGRDTLPLSNLGKGY